MAGASSGDDARLEQACMLGLRRAGIEFDDSRGGALAQVAARASRARFDLPARPAFVPFVAAPAARYPNPALRRLLRRLFGPRARGAADFARLGVRRALAAAELSVHPFDRIALAALVPAAEARAPAAEAPAAEAPAAERAAGQTLSGVQLAAAWSSLEPVARASAVAALRARDAAATRELLVEHFASETAATRVRLLDALAVALGPDDAEFLDRCATDRAASVRERAAALRATLRGTPEYAARLADATTRLTRVEVGIRGVPRIRAERHDKLRGSARADAIGGWFAALCIEDLAAHFGLDEATFLAEIDDAPLAAALCLALAREGKVEAAIALGARFPAALLGRLCVVDASDVTSWSREAQQALLDTAARADEWNDPASEVQALGLASATLDTSLSGAASRALLASSAWAQFVGAEHAKMDLTLDTMAAICHRSARGTLRAQVRRLAPPTGARALDLCDVLDGIESAHTAPVAEA